MSTAPARQENDLLRRRVFARDRGVCALCGWDTVALAGLIHRQAAALTDLMASHDRGAALAAIGREERRWRWLLGFYDRHWMWEVDHLTPQAFGKDDALSNVRTLCVPCHIEHSGTQAAVIAKANRVGKSNAALREILADKGFRARKHPRLEFRVSGWFTERGVHGPSAVDLEDTLADALGRCKGPAREWLLRKARERLTNDWWIAIAQKGGASPEQIDKMHADLAVLLNPERLEPPQLAMEGSTHAVECSPDERGSEANSDGGFMRGGEATPPRVGAGADPVPQGVRERDGQGADHGAPASGLGRDPGSLAGAGP